MPCAAGDRDCAGSSQGGELQGHVPHTSDAEDANPIGGVNLRLLNRRVPGDSWAKEWCGLNVRKSFGHVVDEQGVGHHVLRIATVDSLPSDLLGLAELLSSRVTVGATPASREQG